MAVRLLTIVSTVLKRVRRPGPLVGIAVAYLSATSAIMIWRGISVSPDYILVLLVPIALLSGHLVRFLRDWIPFIAIFLGYEAMRGIAPKAGISPHIQDVASVELSLFGQHLPTAALQSLTPDGTTLRTAISYVATFVYFCHFILPLLIGMVLWLVDRTQFLRYTTALMGMAFAAFVVFLLAPTAPPWYAENLGYIHGFQKLISSALPSAVSPFYQALNANPVAAFPSLHAAFPFLSYLAMRPVYPRASRILLGWCFLVWFSVVYLGEHYVVDVLAGITLASLTWLVLMRIVTPRIAVLRRPVAGGVHDNPLELEQRAVA